VALLLYLTYQSSIPSTVASGLLFHGSRLMLERRVKVSDRLLGLGIDIARVHSVGRGFIESNY